MSVRPRQKERRGRNSVSPYVNICMWYLRITYSGWYVLYALKGFLSTQGLWEVFAVDWDLGTNGISCYRGRHQDCFQSNPWWAPVKGRQRSLVREHIYTYKYVCKYRQIDICMYIWRCTLRGNAEVAAVGCFSQALHTAPCLPLVAMRE